LPTGSKKELLKNSVELGGNVVTFYLYFVNLLCNRLCRTIVREHIPKRHLDFENPIKTDKVFDNTVDRIHGINEQ
jgi:hypothetical protein